MFYIFDIIVIPKIPYPFSRFYIFYLLFLLYALWDWRRSKRLREIKNTGIISLGKRQAIAAWFMKMLVTYYLCVCISYVVLEFGYFDGIVQENKYHLKLFGQPVLAQIHSGSVENYEDNYEPNSSHNLMVGKGYVIIEDTNGFYFYIAERIIYILFVPVFLIILRSLFHSFSIKNPFYIKNVNKLRLLAIVLLSNHILSSIFDKASDQYVRTKVAFSEVNAIRMFETSYDTWLIFISLLLIAEIIRYGVQLKEDQDLTV